MTPKTQPVRIFISIRSVLDLLTTFSSHLACGVPAGTLSDADAAIWLYAGVVVRVRLRCRRVIHKNNVPDARAYYYY